TPNERTKGMIHRTILTQQTIAIRESDHIQGSETAPVTLLEYGDFECPYCGQAYPIVKQIQRRLDQQLRFVFRNFPISTSHPPAAHAAEAAEAAASQGKFWEMHDLLYEHQRALADRDLVGYAASLGLDEARVREDFMSGVYGGVNGTPTFFING